jgi:cytochrome c oxidase assembly protein subunit 15
VATPVAALVALFAVGAQIALGGWTSSNYAATSCPDLPRCQDSWWPNADYGEAFVLWRGLGRNYEGGVLELPARVAIQFAHRLGAVALTLLLLTIGLRALRRPTTARAAALLLAALALQLLLGSLMVLRGFPLWLATAHNAGAALLLLATLSFLLASRAAAGRPTA